MATAPAVPKIQTEVFPLQGGLDLVTPALGLPPGMLIGGVNFEPDINGGYRRMYGYERFDGRTSPSAGSYWTMKVNLTAAVAVGNIVTGATSGATAVVLQVNGTTELIVTKLTGTFVTETINVSAVPKGTVSLVQLNGASTSALHAQYKSLAANNYRADIQAVPGSGPVRGVWYYNGTVYAFRDNVGATACAMYASSTVGWTLINFGRELQFVARSSTVTITIAAPGVVTWNAHALQAGQQVIFTTTGALPTGLTANTPYFVLAPAANTFTVSATSGGAAITTSGTQSGVHTATLISVGISEGDIVFGSVSGAAGTARRVLLRTGTFGSAPVGTIVFDGIIGAFQAGEALTVSTQARLQAAAPDTQISLLPGGRFEFTNYNFSGTTTNYRMYGCDGVNRMFEFDGTRLVPITTGINPDTPKYIAAWKNMLMVAVRSSIQNSGIGQPYSWTALTGAAELSLGDTITGLLPQLGDANTGALAAFTQRNTYVLYGNSSADFKLVLQSPDAGTYPYAAQNIGYAYYLDTKGVVQINSTRNYGNFISSTISRKVQPIIDAKRGLLTASCIVRATNQYRLFFSDGTGLIMYMTPGVVSEDGSVTDRVGAIVQFDYGSDQYMFMVSSTVDITGIERTFAACSNGFVYELERGTSFDGNNITAYFITSFNSSKTPRNRKHYKRIIVQAACTGTATLEIGYDLSYANNDAESGVRTSQDLVGAGSWWDRFTWDQFTWDAPYVTDYEIDTPGDGTNMNMIVYASSAIDDVYTLHSTISNYVVRRLAR